MTRQTTETTETVNRLDLSGFYDRGLFAGGVKALAKIWNIDYEQAHKRVRTWAQTHPKSGDEETPRQKETNNEWWNI